MTRVVYVQNHDKGILPEKQIAVTNGAAARMLGISPRTLSNWRVQGRGPKYIKVGPHRSPVLYRVCDIEAWLDSHLVEGDGKTSAGARR